MLDRRIEKIKGGRKLIALTLCGFLLAWVTFQATKTWAFEQVTHGHLTDRAITHAINTTPLNAGLENSLGLFGGIDTGFSKYILSTGSLVPVQRRRARDWIALGSIYEDEAKRPLNHFHNPLRSDRATAGLKGVPVENPISDIEQITNASTRFGVCKGETACKSMIDWQLIEAGKQAVTGDHNNANMSWEDARNSFFKALTSQHKEDRESNFVDTFTALGAVMHLVQDAASPAHVRDDPHPDFLNFAGIGIPKDYFHEFMEKIENRNFLNLPPIERDLALVLTPGNPQPLANLIDSGKYRSTQSPDVTTNSLNIGLGEFANANFYSDDTWFVSAEHPYPIAPSALPVLATNDKYRRILRNGTTFLEHGIKQGSFLGKPISLFTVRDDAVMRDYAKLLIPRAIGYSAAVLRFFFRGRLHVEGEADADDLVSLRVWNTTGTTASGQPVQMGEGRLYVYYEKTDGTRREVVSQETPVLSDRAAYTFPKFPMPKVADAGDEGALFHVVFKGPLGPPGAQEPGAVIGQMNVFVPRVKLFVPNLVGTQLNAAEPLIRASQLRLGEVTYKQTTDVPAGSILTQSLEAGLRVSENGPILLDTPIDLVVATGPFRVRVEASGYDSGNSCCGHWDWISYEEYKATPNYQETQLDEFTWLHVGDFKALTQAYSSESQTLTAIGLGFSPRYLASEHKLRANQRQRLQSPALRVGK